jgi:hypothetical protein
MFRIQLRLGRLGAVGVLVVASTVTWAPPASAAVQSSSQAVGVVPGPLIPFDPAKPNQNPCGRFPVPDYGINEPGESLPSLEIGWFRKGPDCSSTGYTWSGVGRIDAGGPRITGVTGDALAGLDTLIIYGVRWDSFDPSEQAAINAFAQTHKVVIWDSDSTIGKPIGGVPQSRSYGTYAVPFTVYASGGQKTDATPPVVITPGDLLNAPTPLVDDDLRREPHAIGDMNVMVPANAAAWHVSIRAKNDTLDAAPGGAPSDIVLAWAPVSASGTGLTIYSGMDADALDLTPAQLNGIPRNEALTSFQNQLAASWCSAEPCSIPPSRHSIQVFQVGGGSGTITANPAGGACGALCYDDGTHVTLTVSPNADSVFAGWSGACSTPGPVCDVTVNADVSVTATFVKPIPAPHRLAVTRSGDGEGTVTSSPAGLDCGPVCSANFLSGSAVSLTATPAPGSVFLGWSGACLGVGSCSTTLDADRAVTAVFSTEARRCSITPRTAWLHGSVTLKGFTNVPGATALQALTTTGKQVGSASRAPSAFSVNIDTRKLPTNRTSGVRVRVMNGSTVLCTATTNLRVDNTKARAIKLTHRRAGRYVYITFRPSEAVTVKAYGKGTKPTTVRFTSSKRHTVRVLAGVTRARVQLIDRARNLRTVYVTLH